MVTTMLEFCQDLSVTEYRMGFLIATEGKRKFLGERKLLPFFFFFKETFVGE